LQEAGLADDRVRLVVNRHHQPKELRVAQAEEALGKKIFHLVPDDPARVNAALNQGIPLLQYAPRSAIGRSLSQLAASVNGRHKTS
jgi:pilus assembly protein CpaE